MSPSLLGIGVPIGTDTFVRNFVPKACRSIIDDVEKLDTIKDDFIPYQHIRFCQATRLQFINSHTLLDNRCVLQQQHVECKVADKLLKRGTKQHAEGWDTSRKVWSHIVLHLPHAEDGFGITFHDVTKDSVFYTTTSRFVSWFGASSKERHHLWLPKDDLRDSSSWSSPPLVLLRDIHSKFLHSTTARRSDLRLSHRSMLGLVLESAPRTVFLSSRRLIPSTSRSLTSSLRLHLRDENSASNDDVPVIPSHQRITQQILSH
jgi:hypothetical protein